MSAELSPTQARTALWRHPLQDWNAQRTAWPTMVTEASNGVVRVLGIHGRPFAALLSIPRAGALVDEDSARYTVSVARREMADVIARAASGEAIVITRRDTEVAAVVGVAALTEKLTPALTDDDLDVTEQEPGRGWTVSGVMSGAWALLWSGVSLYVIADTVSYMII